MTPGDRIRQARKAAGLTQQQVADTVGVTKSSVAQWESGQTKNLRGENLVKASKVLGTNPEWLISGHGPMRPEDSSGRAPSTGSNVEPAPGELRWVPLISWVEAGWGAEAIAHLGPGETEEWFPCIARCSPQTFALRVRGDSMLPDYREDEIVFVDPVLEPRHRDEVVVCNEQNGEATMKQILIEGDRTYLQALNRDYPERIRLMTPEDRFCGVVIGLYRERR